MNYGHRLAGKCSKPGEDNFGQIASQDDRKGRTLHVLVKMLQESTAFVHVIVKETAISCKLHVELQMQVALAVAEVAIASSIASPSIDSP
jgi:hypothetical protein